MTIKRIGIIYHPRHGGAASLAEKLCQMARASGADVWLESAWEAGNLKTKIPDSGLVITVGGDGTILRAARAIMPQSIPLLGIKTGQLGFMTELTVAEALERLPEALAGGGWYDARALLEARTSQPGTEVFFALNDVVVARGPVARLIQVAVAIDDGQSSTYRADGVIVATATGSTAYSLAAGGPVLYPVSQDMVLTPILPHPDQGYSYVLPPSSIIRLTVGRAQQASLTVDGHVSIPLNSGDSVEVRCSQEVFTFLRLHPKSPLSARLQNDFKENC